MKKFKKEAYWQQQLLQEGVSRDARVPFLYRQNASAAMMGKPQPLKRLEHAKPSFEPRISKAIKIQRVTLLP